MTGAWLLHTVLALAGVLGLVLAIGWALQRTGRLQRRAPALQVLSQVGLGQKERVVVVAWDGQEWMLGVGPGRVNLIAHRDAPEAAGTDAALTPALSPALPQAFAQQLQQTLARWSPR